MTEHQGHVSEAVDAPVSQVGDLRYSGSAGLARRLGAMNAAVAMTSYQSGLLYFIGRSQNGGLNIHQTSLPKPMGLAMDERGGLTLTAHSQIMRFENTLQPGQAINDTFDACYVPRSVHITGALDSHDVGVDRDGVPIFVNTRFNCLARPSVRHSFEQVWKPSFITDLVDEDRCHLNGLAMQDGRPKYVTAVSRSNTIDGWRDRRVDGGVVIDVENDEVICEGLSMPHSPRLHDGKLWLLNAGTGDLGFIEIDAAGKGKFVPITFCPGFLRGLRFWGDFAFVGLSKPRHERFGGLALDQRLKDADSEPWCGLQVIDLKTGVCVDWFRIDGQISELYDIEILPNVVCPMAVSPMSDEAAALITYPEMPIITPD